MSDLTESELAILRAIDAAPDKVLGWYECRIAAGLTIRGARRVLHGLEERHYIGRSEMPDTYHSRTLTFKGMQALVEAEQVSA